MMIIARNEIPLHVHTYVLYSSFLRLKKYFRIIANVMIRLFILGFTALSTAKVILRMIVSANSKKMISPITKQLLYFMFIPK